MEDPFEKIYPLIRSKKYKEVLALLLNQKTGRIRSPFSRDLNHAWYVVGDVLFRKNSFKKAGQAFKRSLKYRPDDLEAMWALGNCYTELKNPKFAERTFRAALENDDLNNGLRYNLANSLLDQGKYEEALEIYKTTFTNNNDLMRRLNRNIKAAKRMGSESNKR